MVASGPHRTASPPLAHRHGSDHQPVAGELPEGDGPAIAFSQAPVAPFLIAEALASNTGGAATLVGDPPNIIIASRAACPPTTFSAVAEGVDEQYAG
jgi:hypothetical protein